MENDSKETKGKKHQFSADRPIGSIEEDLLGRVPFAKSLASAIKGWQGNESLVVAMYGPWGSGKSSVKNMVLQTLRLAETNCPLIIEFNPWQWSGQNQLAEAFFQEIGLVLGRSDGSEDGKRRAAKWRTYGTYLTFGASLIAPIENVLSILEHGILSNRRAARLPHRSVAMQEIQERRQVKRISNGRLLHEYVNLYFDAHNPMLSKCRAHNDNICVLRVDHTVIDLSGVIVTDRNAAKDFVRFYTVTDGLHALDKNLIYAQFWLNPQDEFDQRYRVGAKCAEVLVPDSVSPDMVVGAYVANQRALAAFEELGTRLPVKINGSMFF